MSVKAPDRFSRCETCNADLGSVRMDAPLYCISCIEEMEKLGMSLKRYKRYRELRESLPKS
ncbi:hypothetical protein HYY73_05385 [Candidatus Woesearchaeota archaeon]|nr:hypothetical protein [Candidatus Woesearchaeota archaeon]